MTTKELTEVSALTDEEAIALGRRMLTRNVGAAILTGAVLLLLASGLFGWKHWLLGLLAGAVYSNAFEYFYHRVILHQTSGRLYQNHQEHHTSFGKADEALHVSFGCSAGAIVVLILANSVPAVLLDWLAGTGIGAGAVIAFTVYFVLFEEFHWRIHMGGLPKVFQFMRRHHYAHHTGKRGAFNVFLPLFDKIFLT